VRSAPALGVVYGDIGTSPLYAIKECLHGEHALDVGASYWSLWTEAESVARLRDRLRADESARRR